MAAVNPSSFSIIQSKLDHLSRYQSDLTGSETINIVHYKSKQERKQQMQEHA